MNTYFYTQDEYLKASQLFHWATKENYVMWFTGSTERHHRTEAILPRLVKKYSNPKTRNRSLFSTSYGKKLIYICPRKKGQGDILYKVDHGLACTDCIVRFARTNGNTEKMSNIVKEERLFRGCGLIPDFGIQFSNSMLLVEYCSNDNFYQWNVIRNKLSAYKRHQWEISEKFQTNTIPVFIIDISKERLAKFLKETTIDIPVYFTDYESFKTVDIGKALSEPIYLFSGDGRKHPLTEDA